jgi:hypothetical protein
MGDKMDDIIGIGKTIDVKTGSTPLDCKIQSSNGAVTEGWACNRTDCESYGKWYCPFSW